MDTEVDLTTVDRDVLIAIIAELQAVIERLQRRIAELAGQAKPDGLPRMPGLKAKSARKPPAQQQRSSSPASSDATALTPVFAILWERYHRTRQISSIALVNSSPQLPNGETCRRHEIQPQLSQHSAVSISRLVPYFTGLSIIAQIR